MLLVISIPLEVCVTSREGLTAYALRMQIEGALHQRGFEQCNIRPWNSFRSHTFLKQFFLFRPCIGNHIEMLQFNFMRIRIHTLKSMWFHLCNTENEKLISTSYTKVPFITKHQCNLEYFCGCKFTKVIFAQHNFLARDSNAVGTYYFR